MRFRFLLLLICSPFVLNAQNNIRLFQEKEEYFFAGDAKMVYGNSSFLINDFIVMENMIVINDIAHGRILLLSSEDNIIKSEYNYFKDIDGLKYTFKPLISRIREIQEDSFVTIENKGITTPFWGANNSLVQLNDSMFYVNLLKITKNYAFFQFKISNFKIIPLITECPSRKKMKRLLNIDEDNDSIYFEQGRYEKELLLYAKYNDFELFQYQNPLIYEIGSNEYSAKVIYSGDTMKSNEGEIIICQGDSMQVPIFWRTSYFFQGDTLQEVIKNKLFHNRLSNFMVEENDYLYMEDDYSIKLFNKDLQCVDSLMVDSTFGAKYSGSFKFLYKDYQLNKLFMLKYDDYKSKNIEVYEIQTDAKTNRMSKKLITVILIDGAQIPPINCIDSGYAYFSTISTLTSDKFIFKLDLFRKDTMKIIFNERLTIYSENPYNHDFSKKITDQQMESLVQIDDYTILKKRECNLLEKNGVLRDEINYPQNTIRDVISSLIKSYDTNNDLYVLYLQAFNEDTYSKVRKLLPDAIIDDVRSKKASNDQHDNISETNKTNTLNFCEFYKELLKNYNSLLFEAQSDSVIICYYKEYSFIIFKIDGKYFMNSIISRRIGFAAIN